MDELDMTNEEVTPEEMVVDVSAEQVQEPVDETAVQSEEQAEPAPQAEAEPNTPTQNVGKKKKGLLKKLIIGLGAGVVVSVAVVLITVLVLFFTVIKPNSIYKDAVAALEQGDIAQCEQLLQKIPNHEGAYELSTQATLAKARIYIEEGELDAAESLLISLSGNQEAKNLKQEIQYQRAVDLVAHGQYADATLLLDKIPEHEDPQQLREQISYEEALAALEIGDYKTAYELFSQLADFKDAATQKEIVYYEALAFKSLFNIQSTLKNPASMYITKVTFYQDSSNENELDAIFEFNATNSYGGSLGAYGYDLTLYDDSEDSGMISQSAYADPDDYIELLYQLLIDSIKKQTVLKTTVDIARMNRLLSGNASFNIDLPFQSADVVDS